MCYYIARDAVLAQSVERILGKDEVGGSNPLDSFRYPNKQLFGFFYCIFTAFSELRPAKCEDLPHENSDAAGSGRDCLSSDKVFHKKMHFPMEF